MYTILGASGFIGAHLTRRLRGAGENVLTPVRGDWAFLTRPLGHAIYCIGLTADYAQRPFDTVDAHVSLLARVLRDGDFESLVYLSSTRLYDGHRGDVDESAALALDPSNPRHLYDLSKALGESLCRANGRSNARVARLSCVYSDAMETDDFLPRLVRDALRTKEVRIAAAPNAERDYVHVRDVCDALVAIARDGRRSVYNVASGTNVTNTELFGLIEGLTGSRFHAGAPTEMPRPPRISIDALKHDLGLAPSSLKDNLHRALASSRRDIRNGTHG